MSDPIRRALVSVSDKTGLAELGRFLAVRGIEVLSTGGSAKALADAGVPVTEVAAYTGFPEIMDGRVKTLQPRIHGGLLAVRGDWNENFRRAARLSIAPASCWPDRGSRVEPKASISVKGSKRF